MFSISISTHTQRHTHLFKWSADEKRQANFFLRLILTCMKGSKGNLHPVFISHMSSKERQKALFFCFTYESHVTGYSWASKATDRHMGSYIIYFLNPKMRFYFLRGGRTFHCAKHNAVKCNPNILHKSVCWISFVYNSNVLISAKVSYFR